MNKNVTALILIVLGVGIYFTYTSSKIDELKGIKVVNAEYQQAINNSARLIKERDKVLKSYNDISEIDRERLNKIVPDNVDNVRLIIDVKDNIAARHGLFLKNIKTSSPDKQTDKTGSIPGTPNVVKNEGEPTSSGVSTKYGIVTLSFSVTSKYETFISFLQDLESSLRIMDISKLTVGVGEDEVYDFEVELKTYWLKK